MNTGFTRLTVLAFLLAGILALDTFKAAADLEISADVQISAAADFYEPLAPNGSWVEVDGYGRCWHPAVAEGWRPYCDGTWVWTDCGWYWQSDEPWAWACYHYGSWILDPRFGWVWIPGVEWAPAWVYWRTGGDYIGWAPCSPRGPVVVAGAFVFVEERHFHDRHRPTTVIVNNVNIFNDTRQIGESRRESRDIDGRHKTVMVNNGPDVNEIERATGKRVAPVSVQEVDRRTVVPPTVRHERHESPGGTKSPAVQDRTGPVEKHDHTAPEPNHNLPPGEMPGRPNLPVPPDKNLPPAKQEITPPTQPPSHHEIPHQAPIPETPATPSAPLPKHEIVPPSQPPSQPTSPHEAPKTSPSGPPSKHEVTPQHRPPQPPPESAHPAAGPEERNDQGQGHEKDKDRQ